MSNLPDRMFAKVDFDSAGGVDLEPYAVFGVDASDYADAHCHGAMSGIPSDSFDIIVETIIYDTYGVALVEEAVVVFFEVEDVSFAVHFADKQFCAA